MHQGKQSLREIAEVSEIYCQVHFGAQQAKAGFFSKTFSSEVSSEWLLILKLMPSLGSAYRLQNSGLSPMTHPG